MVYALWVERGGLHLSTLQELQVRIARITDPITIVLKSPDRQNSLTAAAWELIDTLQEKSAPLDVVWEAWDTPGVLLSLKTHGVTGPIQFLGTPSGFELEGFVLAVESLESKNSGPWPLAENLGVVLSQITTPIRSDLYVAPT